MKEYGMFSDEGDLAVHRAIEKLLTRYGSSVLDDDGKPMTGAVNAVMSAVEDYGDGMELSEHDSFEPVVGMYEVNTEDVQHAIEKAIAEGAAGLQRLDTFEVVIV